MNPTPTLWPGMHIAPAPATLIVSTVPGQRLVALRFETVIGSIVILVDPDAAESFGADVTRHAREARTGLHLPATPAATQ